MNMPLLTDEVPVQSPPRTKEFPWLVTYASSIIRGSSDGLITYGLASEMEVILSDELVFKVPLPVIPGPVSWNIPGRTSVPL
jgi:hypothetical protein